MTRTVFVVAAAILVFAAAAVAYPVSSPDKVVDRVAAPAANPHEVKTTTLTGAAAAVPLLPDLPAGKFGLDSITQIVTIKNASQSAGRLCVLTAAIPVPVVGATDTCAEVCAADAAVIAMTCNEAAPASTDGEWIDPGETMPYRDTGNLCYCGFSQLGAKAQGRRVAR